MLDCAQIILYKLRNGYKIPRRQIIQPKEKQQVLRPDRRDVSEGFQFFGIIILSRNWLPTLRQDRGIQILRSVGKNLRQITDGLEIDWWGKKVKEQIASNGNRI